MHSGLTGESAPDGVYDGAYRRFVDNIGIPAALIERSGALVECGHEWQRVLGCGDGEPWEWVAPVVPEQRARVIRDVVRALTERASAEIDVDVRRHDGSLGTFVLVASACADVDAVLVVAWDVTDRRLNEERLAFMAGHDPLTGLANRRAFDEALVRAVARAERGNHATLLMLDLDRLKSYNDRRGHLAGDQALVNLSMVLRTHVRVSDTVARIGGDEFAVILEDGADTVASEIAERIRSVVASEDFVPQAIDHGLTVSGGLARIEPGVEARVALDRADTALYSAKDAGRDRIVSWVPELGTSVPAERLSTRVRDAFVSDGFFLVFQPVVRLEDQGVVYFESLVRMRASDGTVYGPSEFLPCVARLGLMSRLTKRVVDLALWNLATTPGASVSVNVSQSDLADTALLDEVEHALKAAASSGRVVFEIAEGELLSNLAGGREWVRRLTPLGARFVLDDFGTGVGIFVLLQEPGFTQIKLSRAVVRALTVEDATRKFVMALRELIESQGKDAVATYLETEQLLGDVRDAGFTWGQGYGVGEPAEDLAALNARFTALVEPLG